MSYYDVAVAIHGKSMLLFSIVYNGLCPKLFQQIAFCSNDRLHSKIVQFARWTLHEDWENRAEVLLYSINFSTRELLESI